MRIIRSILLAVVVLFCFPGCFSILQFLSFNADGSLHVTWRLTIPSALADGPASGASGGPGPEESLANAEKEIKAELGDIAKNLKVERIKTEHAMGLGIDFDVDGFSVLPAKPPEGMTMLPGYNAKRKELRIAFTPSARQKLGAPPVPQKKPGAEGDTEASESAQENSGAQDEQMRKISGLFLSGAYYDLILAENINAVGAYIETRGEKAQRTELEFLQLGDVRMVRIPFMTLLLANEEGYDLVVRVK